MPVLILKSLISTEYLLPQIIGDGSTIDNRTRLPSAICQIGHVVRIDTIQSFVQGIPGIGLIENVTIGRGSDGKAIGHFDALRNEFPVHFPERGCLAPNQRNVIHPQVFKESDVFECLAPVFLLLLIINELLFARISPFDLSARLLNIFATVPASDAWLGFLSHVPSKIATVFPKEDSMSSELHQILQEEQPETVTPDHAGTSPTQRCHK